MRKVLGMIGVILSALLLACAEASPLPVNAAGIVALIDDSGNALIEPETYDSIFTLIDGECYAAGKVQNDVMRYALCDALGQLITGFEYDALFVYGGEVLFRQNGYCGALDIEGHVRIEPEYTMLVSNGEGGYLAFNTDPNDTEADELIYVLPNEEPVHTKVRTLIGLSEVVLDRMPFCSDANNMYGYVNARGEIAIPAQLDYAGGFQNGAARAMRNGKYGLLNSNGEWVIAPSYAYLEQGDDLIIAMEESRLFIAYDAKDYSELFWLEANAQNISLVGAYPVLTDLKGTRVYTRNGSVLLESELELSVSAAPDGALIVSDGQWGAPCEAIVYPDGAVSESRYQQLLPLAPNRYAFLEMNTAAYYSAALDEIRYSCDYDSMRYGMIDSEGKEILAPVYLEIQALSENRFLTVAADGVRVVDENGELLWACVEEETPTEASE